MGRTGGILVLIGVVGLIDWLPARERGRPAADRAPERKAEPETLAGRRDRVRFQTRLARFARALRAPAEHTPPPVADPRGASERVRELTKTGLDHVWAKRWDEAGEAFLDAYEAMPEPHLLLGTAMVYERAGRCDEAIDYYTWYLEDAPDEPPHPALVERAHKALAKLRATCPP
jgi:tetratricopeptide (TPR) repeat protein